MRHITITIKDYNGQTCHDTAMFDRKKMTDSEALHRFLCELNPGDSYSVGFSNKPKRGKNIETWGVLPS